MTSDFEKILKDQLMLIQSSEENFEIDENKSHD